MRRSFRDKPSADSSDVDLTPMMDMVFILLVFFIVSTSFIKEAGVVIERPAATTGQAQEAQVVVAIDAANVLWMEGQSIDIRALPTRLAQLYAENDQLAVIAAADVRSSSGVLVKVIDTCRQVGIRDVSVATKEP